MGEIESGHQELLNGVDVAAAAEEKETHSFEIDPAQVRYGLFTSIGWAHSSIIIK